MKFYDLYRPKSGSYITSQILRIMKLTVLIITIFLLQASASTKAQNINLNEKNASLEKIIKIIRVQSGFDFFGDTKLIRTAKPITINVKQATIEEALQICFANQGLSFSISENTVIVKLKENDRKSGFAAKRITGKITDKDKLGIPNATIKIKGKTGGTFSAKDGSFSLAVDENDILIVSIVGFKSKEVPVKGQSVFNITLEEDEQTMQDVVVTGYFNRDKTSFTGASRTITRQELQKYSSANIFSILQNIDASFKVQESNNFGSDPNRIPDMTIRGRGSFLNASVAPVFIVDGFEMSLQKVFDMDVNRIESVTLLKDASATILYGSRAANGVVVIETRAPEAGKVRVTYDVKPTLAIADLSDYQLMNARQKLEFEKLAGIYTATDVKEEDRIRNQMNLDENYYTKYKEVARGVDTYWLSQPVQNALSAAHSLFVEGGSQEVRYGVEANYNNNKGVMKQSGRDRYGVGFSLNYRLKDKITIRNYASYSGSSAYESPFGSFSAYTSLNPYETPFDETTGKYKARFNDASGGRKNTINPLYDSYLPNKNLSRTQTFNEQLNVDWYINSDFRLNAAFRLQKDINDSERYTSPRSSLYDTVTSVARKGHLGLTNGNGLDMTGNIRASYKRVLGKHVILSGIAGEIKENSRRNYGFQLSGFADDRFADPAFAIQYLQDSRATSSEATTRSLGVLGTFNYMYDNRYFTDFSFRQDGSSQFGASNRFAPFYSLGVGWNLHNEKFWDKDGVVNEIRLRSSYGLTGNQEFTAYQAQTSYGFRTDRLYYNTVSALLLGYGNENLKWQKQKMTNIGSDIALLKSRIRISAEYYIRRTDGLLTDVTVAPSLGFPGNSYKENLGEIENTGYELNLNAVIFKQTQNRPEWAMSFQGASNKSKLLKVSNALKKANDAANTGLSTDLKGALYIPRYIYEEGKSMTAINAVHSLGIDPATGKEMFMTKEGQITYTWNAADKITAGDTEPTLFGNIGTNVAYRGWNLTAVMQYRFGGQMYNSTLVTRVEGANPLDNADIRVLEERWKKPGDLSFYKDISDRSPSYISDRFVQNESTISLNSLSLSYDFAKPMVQKLGMERAKFTFYMNDIMRFSTIKLERGLDYPFARSLVFGLNVTF